MTISLDIGCKYKCGILRLLVVHLKSKIGRISGLISINIVPFTEKEAA
jgi:hypothetical protein